MDRLPTDEKATLWLAVLGPLLLAVPLSMLTGWPVPALWTLGQALGVTAWVWAWMYFRWSR